MQNFVFYNPTKILFGKGAIAGIAAEIDKKQRILITYGGGSVKANGVLDSVKSALEGYTLFEFGGIEPNPCYETLMKAVKLVREERIDYLLAVGGGSVIDGTKFIAAAVDFAGEPWDILAKGARVEKALPMGTVLTLPATGSEMNSGSVVSRLSSKDKLFFTSDLVYPRFSALDPVTTYTLPPAQISNGIVDTFVHIMEQYLTYPVHGSVQDSFSEGLLRTLIEMGPKALQEPQNYDVRADIMWAATLGLNGLIGAGVPQDWTSHMIGHEITCLYGIDHARTLAIVLPSVMQFKREQKREKLLQYAERVWGITAGDDEAKIDAVIAKTREFFESLQIKTHLGDYGITQNDIAQIVAQLERHGMLKLGERRDINPEESRRILELSL